MGQDYLMRDIASWIAKQPFDQYGHALDPYDRTADGNQARELTSPFGSLQYCIGDGECFICLDFGILDDNRVALHSVVHTDHYVGDMEYAIVQTADAVNVAVGLCEQAMQWCYEAEVDCSDPDTDPYYFARSVAHALHKLGRPLVRKARGRQLP